ncbi:MAG: hypothetical protein ACJA1Z_000094 [Patiriisocius sp.]|jgi:hypothetical protein
MRKKTTRLDNKKEALNWPKEYALYRNQIW